MSLNKLIDKKNLNILGLNSGTSADSLDMSLVKIGFDNKKLKVTYIAGKEIKYQAKLKEKIIEFSQAKKVDLEKLVIFDNYLGDFYGRQARKYIDKLNKNNLKIDLIASHGQTIRHIPQKTEYQKRRLNGTCQIGSADFIASHTGKTVISDFRQADIAAGGEGAPITTPAIKLLFQSNKTSRMIINIGGISNYFYIPASRSLKDVIAADCGPGNSLVDLLSYKLFGVNYDKNGRFAQKGRINERLVNHLMKNPFFKTNQKSTGREIFGTRLADEILKLAKKMNLSKYDIIASTSDFTVRAIVKKISDLLKKDTNLRKLYLTGGGRKNIFFKQILSEYLDPLEVTDIDDLGLNGDFLEAVSYAVLGFLSLKSIPVATERNNKRKPIAIPGKIVQPPG